LPFWFAATVETEPKPEDLRLFEDRIYEFNVQATGIADGKLITLFLRDNKGAAVGGIYGWTWGVIGFFESQIKNLITERIRLFGNSLIEERRHTRAFIGGSYASIKSIISRLLERFTCAQEMCTGE